MRICFFLFLLVCQSASAQLKEINAKNVDREMVRLTDTLYVCRTEVTNMEYRFFLSAIVLILFYLHARGKYQSSCLNSVSANMENDIISNRRILSTLTHCKNDLYLVYILYFLEI